MTHRSPRVRLIDRLRLAAARVRALAPGGRRDGEFDEEVAHHLAAFEEEARARGAGPEQARLAALRAFGGVSRTREAWREQRGFARVEACWLDLRIAARALVRRPLLFAAAAASIAVGVGLNLGVYAAITRVLFETPLSGAAGGRLVAIDGEISFPNYEDLRALHAFEGVAAMQVSRLPWRSASGTTRVGAKIVSANFFDVVGVRAARGRTFHGGEEAATVVLGDAFWRRRLGGDPSAIGRTLTINGWPYVVAGILPPAFNAPVAPMVASDVYLAISPHVCEALTRRGAPQFDLVARLREGVTPEQARAAVAIAAADLERRYPRENARFASHVSVEPTAGVALWHAVAGGAFPLVLAAAATIYAIVGLVLLVACANVAGLLLSRAEERRRELAVCAALGATRWRLAQRFVAESAIIALVGCALAALLFRVAVAAITRTAWTAGELTLTLPPLPLGYCAALVAAVTLACAIAPAWAVGVIAPLPGAASSPSGRGATRACRLLVVAQVAMCVVLLSGASILVHDVLRVRGVDPGFDTAHTMMIELRVPAWERQVRARPFERVRAAIRGVPGVESVSAARNMPLMFVAAGTTVYTEPAPATRLRADVIPAGPHYLETLRIPLVRGRDLADLDLRYTGRTTAVVVNQTLARRMFGAADPVGQTFQAADDGRPGADHIFEIVGVARDTALRSLDQDPYPAIYMPEVGDFYFVRVAGDPAAALRTVELAITRVEPNAWMQAQPLAAQVEFAKRPARIGSAALAALGATGLAMAMVGLYAIVAHSVNRRTFEIGVRLALGATRVHVLALILREGIALVAIGCAVGAAAAAILARMLSSVITLNQGRFDPLALGAVIAATVAVGAVASLAPARLAACVDPAAALRAE